MQNEYRHPQEHTSPFRSHQQTSTRFPIRNARQERLPHRSRWERTHRKARAKRPMPLRFRAQVLRTVACAQAVTTASHVTTTSD